MDVTDDAMLRMVYHIDWKVLDSSSDPLTWVLIGIPNSRYASMRGLSGAVKEIGYSSSGGSSVRIDLDHPYYEGDVADIEFEVVQDYMYQVDQLTEGETVYSFTPGWFDEIRVDELIVRWNGDKVLSQSPACTMESDGYYTWRTSLPKGERYTVTVTYPTDAFAFDVSKTAEYGDESDDDLAWIIIGIIVVIALFSAPLLIIGIAVAIFGKTANFSDGTQKKVTRTKIVYYPECQGCGGPRPEGASNCPYCGRSFIQSEEVIEEKDIPAEEKDLRKKTTDGLYRYSSQPNTYIRVHVTHVPVPRSSSYSSRGSSSHHSSCAHSSCACACACACAGGGRAGCSVKDFYSTHLKLRQLAAMDHGGK